MTIFVDDITSANSAGINVTSTDVQILSNDNSGLLPILNTITTSLTDIKLRCDDTSLATTIELVLTPTTISIPTIQQFANDAAAGVGGLVLGDIYETDGTGAAPLNVAGILMRKQ
jgi:hypothetical protein